MKRIKVVALALMLTLYSACGGKVTTQPGQATQGDNVLRGAKTFGQVLAMSLDEGIKLEAQLAADGTIDPAVEPDLRQKLQQGKQSVDSFNSRIAKYDHFDPASKSDIMAFLDEATAFISDVNANGLLQIKKPRSQLIASGIIAGARTAVTIYRSTFDQVK